MQRLGKQRVETLQIMKSICGGLTKKGTPYKGWPNHPAVNMWRGYEGALLRYQYATVQEWSRRPRKSGKPGAPDTCLDQTIEVYQAWAAATTSEYSLLKMPPWLGREDVHESHRSKLIEKDPVHYMPLFAADTRLGLDYVWPV